MANPLHALHQSSPAVEFQPYGPIEIVSTFGEPQAEYAAIRKGAALIDLPQRGFLELTGKDRHAFLNNLLTNQTWDKATKKGPAAGTGAYAFFLNLKGRIVADVNVLELADRTLLEMDVRLVPMLRSTFDLYLFAEQVRMTDRSAELHEIALHGPRAIDVLRQATGTASPALAPLSSTTVRLFDVEAVAWRDDVAGVPGYHLIVPSPSAAGVWSTLVSRFGFAAELGKRMLRPIGWAAFNAARIEAGRPMLDIDFPAAPADRPGKKLSDAELEAAAAQGGGGASNPGVLPAETGLFARAVSVTKGCYLGQEIVARMYARQQVARQIAGIRMTDDHLPLAGAKVFDDKGNEIGVVTSSTISPILSGAAIGLAYLKRPFFVVGTKLTVPAEGAMREATVVELPFVKPELPDHARMEVGG